MEEDICSAKKRGRDLTVDSLKIAGKEPVRDVIVLIPKDAIRKKQGKYEFSMSYRVNNEGYLASRDFENLAYFNDQIVSRQQGLSLGPNESKVITDNEVGLDIKDGVFLVRIDAFSKVMEDNETNNDISTKLVFKGFQPNAPSEPGLHIEMLRIAGKTPVRGVLKLQKKDSLGEKKGRYAFPLEYVMRNYGLQDAVDFENLYLLDGKSFFRQHNLSIKAGESKLMTLPVYLPIRNGKFTLKVDANSKYPRDPCCKQTIEVQVYFQGF